MKRWLRWVGIVLLVVGIVWFLQGINVLPGSFMTGQSFWAWAGIGCIVAGAVVLVGSASERA